MIFLKYRYILHHYFLKQTILIKGVFWSNDYIKYESNIDRNKTLSLEEDLNKIRPFLKDIINNLKNSDGWKSKSTIAKNFISSIDKNEEKVMYSKSDKIEIRINNEAHEVIKEPFDSIKIDKSK